MKHIYIFTTESRASLYGIGTYIQNLLTILRVSPYSVTVVNMFAPVEAVNLTWKDNIRYISIPKPNHFRSLFKGPEQVAQDNRILEAVALIIQPYINPDQENIFHLNSLFNILLAKRLKEYYGGKIIITVHFMEWSFDLDGDNKSFCQLLSADYSTLDKEQKWIIEKFKAECSMLNLYADKVIAISQYLHGELLTLYKTDKNKIELIPNAIEDQFGQEISSRDQKNNIRNKLHIRNDEIILIFAGRMDPGKGVEILIEALKIVLNLHTHTHLILAGDGNFPELLELASSSWMKITFTGYLPRPVLYDLYKAADIGIIPSKHESFGYIAVEMMMHALPVVVADNTALSEIVDDGINGIKIPHRTAKAFSEKILQLINNPALRLKLGNAGRKKFNSQYDLKCWDNMLDLYKSI